MRTTVEARSRRAGLALALLMSCQLASAPCVEATKAAVTGDTLVTAARTYRGIAFSALDQDSTASTLFNELGPRDPYVWRAFAWDPAAHAYQEAAVDFEQIARGRGYWLITRDARTVHSQGTSFADTVDIPLLRGPGGAAAAWNQLGNPFPFDLAIANWSVVKRDTQATLFGPGDSFTDPSAGLQVYTPGAGFGSRTVVRKNEAFWVRVADTDTTPSWVRWNAASEAPDTVVAGPHAFAIDPTGVVHLAYGARDTLFHAERHGFSWRIEPIAAFSGGGQEVAMTIDRLGRPLIVYIQNAREDVVYARKVASAWQLTTIERIGVNEPFWRPAVTVDAQDTVTIAVWDNYQVKVRCYGLKNSTYTSIESINYIMDNRPITLALASDPGGVPHILYTNTGSPGSPDFYYVSRAGPGDWPFEILAGGFEDDHYDLTFDATGRAHIVYGDPTDRSVHYAVKDSEGWHYGDDPPGKADDVRIAIVHGEPWIAMLDIPSGKLRVSRHYTDDHLSPPNGWTAPEDAGDVPGGAARLFGAATAPDGATLWAATSEDGPTGSEVRVHERSIASVHLRLPAIEAPVAAPSTGSRPIPGTQWSLSLRASQAGRTDAELQLGAANVAEGRWNALAMPRLPLPPGAGALELYVRHPDWGAMSDDYVRDFQRPAARMAWHVMLAGAAPPGEVTLRFTSADAPADLRFTLEDHGTSYVVAPGAALSLAPALDCQELTLTATRSEPSAAIEAPENRFLLASPTPFSHRVALMFSVPRPAELEARIFDVQGRLIRCLHEPATTPGQHLLIWDGHDDASRAAPAGVYLVHHRVGSRTGTTRIVKLE